MKRLIWILFFAPIAFSCKDDENVNITGTWLYVSEEYTNCEDPDDNESFSDDDGCDDGFCETIEFSKGKYILTEIEGGASYPESGTYKLSGSKLTIDDDFSVTVKRSGNTLTMSYDEFGCDTKIVFTKVD